MVGKALIHTAMVGKALIHTDLLTGIFSKYQQTLISHFNIIPGAITPHFVAKQLVNGLWE